MIASAGDWGLVALVVLMILSVWALYGLWVVRHGVRSVAVEFRSEKEPDDALRDWAGYYTEWLASYGYALVSQGHGTITYWRRYFPSWSVAVAVLLFPLGLLALLARSDATVVVTARPDSSGTRLDVGGKAHRRIAKELESDAAEAPREPVAS